MKDQRTAKLYDSITDVDNRFIQEAAEIPEIRKKRTTRWMKLGTWAACFCFLAAGAILWHFSSIPSDRPPHGETQIGIGTQPGEVQPEGTVPESPISVRLSDITFNRLSDQQLDASRLWRDPALYEEVFWDEKAVQEYYGRALTPAYIPEGLLAGSGNGTGNAYIQKSDGKIIEDKMWLNFYHAYYEDGNPKLTDDIPALKGFQLHASKLGIVLGCGLYILPENEVETSDIGGTAVTFGYRPMEYGPYDPETHEPAGSYDLYTAEFEHEGVQYEIVTEQLEKTEIVKIVSSIIYGEEIEFQ